MSSGKECEFQEREPGQWYYLLEHDFIDSAWDWREDASEYGPFVSYEEAWEHLRENHPNPGGHSVIDNEAWRGIHSHSRRTL